MKKYRAVSERLGDYRPVERRLDPEELASSLKLCQDCGIPFCHAVGCPLGNAIPEINAQALAGRWRSALATLLDTNPFPEITARICPALCEGSCVQGMHGEAVPCRQVEKEIVERGFAAGLIRPEPPAQRIGQRVAIIGSGPAGLAAAWKLNRTGFDVVVYEKDEKPGGFLRYGIPDFKLEKKVLDRRMDLLQEEGILFECDVNVGRDISTRLLKKRADMIVVAVGSRKNRNLDVPGRELGGIHFAVDYLSAANRSVSGEKRLPQRFNAAGRHVVVIGGGDTGSDCLGSALRQGAASVTQLEILPEPPCSRAGDNPWPEWPRIRRDSSSHEEGGVRMWSTTTCAFLPSGARNGTVGGLRVAPVEWRVREPGGKRTPCPVPGAETDIPADMVLLAMGFTGPEESAAFEELGLAERSGRLISGDDACMDFPRVHVAGDAGSGPGLVVRAMADGLRAAGIISESRLGVSLSEQ